MADLEFKFDVSNAVEAIERLSGAVDAFRDAQRELLSALADASAEIASIHLDTGAVSDE